MAARSTARPYHHGDLAAALVTAGLDLARSGGPDAIGLREVTRAVGVTPNAAYRHFADRAALVLAVAGRAQEQVATAMQARLSAVDQQLDAASRARARLRAVGLGYVDFALAEPGLFQLAFASHEQYAAAQEDPPPFRLLVEALDELAAAGVLPADRRPNAEWPCWSAVHGIADLATRGPLREQPAEVVGPLVELVIDCAIAGVVGPVTCER